MDRKKAFTFLVGFALGAAIVTGVVFAHSLATGVTTSGECPLEFGVWTLETPDGWFYRVIGLKTGPMLLSEYIVVFYVWGLPDPPKQPPDQTKVIHYQGPLPDLIGASGNFSFQDSGVHPGQLDDGGDYFFAETWHNLELYRSGQVIGGTLACA